MLTRKATAGVPRDDVKATDGMLRHIEEPQIGKLSVAPSDRIALLLQDNTTIHSNLVLSRRDRSEGGTRTSVS